MEKVGEPTGRLVGKRCDIGSMDAVRSRHITLTGNLALLPANSTLVVKKSVQPILNVKDRGKIHYLPGFFFEGTSPFQTTSFGHV